MRALAGRRGGPARVNEYLTKPVSAKALHDRLLSITALPRPVVQLGEYYGPEPRKLVTEAADEKVLASTVAAAIVS